MSKEKKAILLASSASIFLIIIKGLVGFYSGSMVVLTSAVDSLLDFGVSLLNFFAIKKSEEPDDDDHNYGHGKIEGFGALFEGLIIFLSGFAIIYFSVIKIINKDFSGGSKESIIVMLISVFITFFLVFYLSKISKETGSLILKADTLHYKSDLYTNLGIIISLIIIKIFGFGIIDPIVSIFIALYIIYSSTNVIGEGYKMLMDHAIDSQYIDIIKSSILSYNEVSSYHFLKTRKSGKINYIEFHVVFANPLISLKLAHDTGDKIELDILRKIPDSQVIIHLDYFDDSNNIDNPKILVKN